MEKLWKGEFRQIEFEGRYATLIFPPENGYILEKAYHRKMKN